MIRKETVRALVDERISELANGLFVVDLPYLQQMLFM
jgi:hypothetical protein